MKKVAVFGSSGSIGVNSLEVVRTHPQSFHVSALAVNTNIDLLERQIAEFKPRAAAVTDLNKADELRKRGVSCEILSGNEGLRELARSAEYDILLGAQVGFSGLVPTVEAIKRGKRIALANKETLVVAGELITELCEQYGAELLPVDSEHSAIFQCLQGEKHHEVKKLLLTASGGPFFSKTKEELKHVTLQQALKHPTWSMGAKITVDSATLMNKGLEIIEAKWLFAVEPERIAVVVHPQSIIHSMVEFIDGSIKAQLSVPDMKISIRYALTYPERFPAPYAETVLPKIGSFTFHNPDLEAFPALGLAFDALRSGGTASCILNAANEVAVDLFLTEKISFVDIPQFVRSTMEHFPASKYSSIEELIAIDAEARIFTRNTFTQSGTK